MNSLAVNLSKEWREQRSALGVLAIALCAGVTAVGAILPRMWSKDPHVAQWIVGLTVLATVMSTGADLLARERQRGLSFLARIPHGLERAARGKFCFFALVLCGAFVFGSFLAACVSLVRTGELPHGAFDNPAAWLPSALGISLWVFAVSAWMSNSALTVPAALFFLATFAWPAVLAMTNDAVFRPTPTEGLVFVALCIAGAPVSAWASFVIGSRRGRTRVHAALIGMLVAVPFFAPSWIWAGARYHAYTTRPLSIWVGLLGTNPRFAFLDLIRRRPDATYGSRDDEPSTAMVVDLDRGTWKFAGAVDSSAFCEDVSFGRYDSLLGDLGCPRLTLYDSRSGEVGATFDGSTGEPMKGASAPALDPRLPTPADFGRPDIASQFSIRWAGCGQVLRYSDGHKTHVLYRDIERNLVVDDEAMHEGNLHEVRVRPGRWLVQCSNSWSWFDPISRERAPITSIRPKDQLGPSLSDGRFVLRADNALWLFDPNTDERLPIEVLGLDASDVIAVQKPGNGPAPISFDSPAIVWLSTSNSNGLALFDARARTLRATIAFGGRRTFSFLRQEGPRALVIEELRQIVRYDFERNSREVLFDIANVH